MPSKNANSFLTVNSLSLSTASILTIVGGELKRFTGQTIVIDSSGNVGVGTVSPAAKLDVSGGGARVQGLTNPASGSGIEFGYDTTQGVIQSFSNRATLTQAPLLLDNASYKVRVGGADKIVIDSSGNVGIGVTSSAAKIHVQGAGTTSAAYTNGDAVGQTLYLQDTGNLAGNGGQILFGASQGVFAGIKSSIVSGTGPAGNLIFQTRDTTGNVLDRMTVTREGNVRIGTTSFLGNGGQALSVKQNADGWGMAVQVTTNGNYGLVAINASNSIVGGMIIGASGTSFPTSSDYRLKTNIEPIINGIERVKQLPVYRFNWKIDESGNKVDGFVAHEAKAIVPESVVGEKDAVDADGNPVYQGIDQSKIVPLLTAALKEAIAKIETLESKVTALEAAQKK